MIGLEDNIILDIKHSQEQLRNYFLNPSIQFGTHQLCSKKITPLPMCSEINMEDKIR